MFAEILFGLVVVILGIVWLVSPLLVFSLLGRTNRLEQQLRQLRIAMQDLASRNEAATEGGREEAHRGAAVANRAPQRQSVVRPSRHETDGQRNDAALKVVAVGDQQPVSLAVAPPLPSAALSPEFRKKELGDRSRVQQHREQRHELAEMEDGSSGGIAAEADDEQAVAPRLWEERIGGHWLNRIGGLLLVIGITLFVGYSLQQLGPRGRLAVGAAVSLGLLGGGVFAQQWQAYRVLSASLVATGWAGLYITAYAAYGIPASRIIEHPVIAMGLLVAVAAGMVAHSLRYRMPLVTALAYLFGFVAISISPVGPWSAYGCVILAVTMLAVSVGYRWDGLAVAGLLFTYGTLLLRGQEMFAAAPLWQGFTAGHGILLICWLAFESYDIVMLAKGPAMGVGRAILPLNLCCLLAAATGLWPNSVSPSVLSTAMAVAYAASTVIRLAVRRPTAFGEGSTPLDRGILGGYEATVTVAATATAVTIWHRFPDVAGWRLILLMVEAESLFLLGFFFRQPFLRQLALPFFTFCLLPLQQTAGEEHIWWSWGGLVPLRWVPHAVGMASVFAVNRVLARCVNPLPQHSLDSFYSYAATGLLAACVVAEGSVGQLGLEPHHIGVVGILAAWLLLQLAIRADLDELSIQTQFVGIAGGVATFLMNGFLAGLPVGVAAVEAWGWLPPAAAVCGACGWQLSRGLVAARWRRHLSTFRSLAVAASIWLLVLFFWHLLPAPAVAIAWMLMAMLILAVGQRLGEPSLRLQGHVLCIAVAGRLFLANFTTFGMTAGLSHRLLTVVPIASAFAFLAWSSPRQEGGSPASAGVEAFMRRFCLHFATLAFAVLLRFELGRVLALPAWAVLGVVLLVIEKRWASADLRLQAMVLAVVCCVRSWNTHFFIPEGTLGAAGPAVIGSVVILCLFACMFLCPRPAGLAPPGTGTLVWGLRQSRIVYAAMATVLWAVLLYHEVPWRAITAAWGLEGALLVVAGFALRDRILRLAGLAVLGLCLPKLFFYDLRNLDTPARIASFVLLGAVLIAASWAYTRFRSQVRELLEDRQP
jgi:hypothetical protein